MIVKVRLDTILAIYMCGARIIDANVRWANVWWAIVRWAKVLRPLERRVWGDTLCVWRTEGVNASSHCYSLLTCALYMILCIVE